MQNKYYQLSSQEKLRFRLKLILLCLLILLPIFYLSYFFQVYVFSAFSLWCVISIVAPFFDVPAMINTGKLKYQSLLLISEKEKNNSITIHGGTLFDYYFVLNEKDSSKQRKNFILLEYLNGIINLMDANKEKPNLKITGTTYILNKRTAEKIGFEALKTSWVQSLILVLNYPNLVVTKSFVNRKLSLPNLNNIQTYHTKIQTLNKNRATITKIRDGLENTAVTNEFWA